MDIKEIKQIVDLMKKSDLTEFSVEEENFKLQIKRAAGSSLPASAASHDVPFEAGYSAVRPISNLPQSGTASADPGSFITSPMVGTFYTAPSPESPPYVSVGDSVQADTVVCIIEAMKIMNEIQSEKKGSIAEILIANGQPVEFGQRLYRLA